MRRGSIGVFFFFFHSDCYQIVNITIFVTRSRGMAQTEKGSAYTTFVIIAHTMILNHVNWIMWYFFFFFFFFFLGRDQLEQVMPRNCCKWVQPAKKILKKEDVETSISSHWWTYFAIVFLVRQQRRISSLILGFVI